MLPLNNCIIAKFLVNSGFMMMSMSMMMMVTLMCGVKLSDKVACEELRGRLGLEDVVTVLQRNRLRWYGHVLGKGDSEWVKKCMDFVVERVRPGGDQREHGRK